MILRRLLPAVVACAVVAGGAMAWRSAHAPRTTYCVTFDDTNDGPRCALPIDAERVARRYHSTGRLTEVAGHTTRVEFVNFAGERWPRETSFDDDDDLRRDVIRGEDGQVRAILTRNASGVLESHEKWSEDGKRVDFVDQDGTTPRHASDTARYTTLRRELDGQGRVVRERYFGPTGRPRTNEDGVYGKAIEYGKTWGARVKVTDLGADGLPAPRRSGAAIVRATDDEVPGGRETTTYDVEDRPFADDGVFKKVRAWDATDVTRVAVFGLGGEPAVGLSASVHQIESTFNPKTHVQVFAYQDERGKPQACRDRWFSAVRITQDAHGRDVLVESLDADGNRTLVKDGIAAARCTYDESGQEIRREHLDPSGAPMTGSQDGYARVDLKKDGHGNTLEERFFDEHGAPAPLREGVAIRRTAFDDRDLPIAVANLDVAEKPVTNRDGWASKRLRYDRLRNLVEVAYLGVDGKPTVDDGGVSIQRWTYDENDDLVSVAYFDVAGAPTMRQGDYASKRTTHDERGLATEEELLDVHGDPVLRQEGYATIKRTFDRNGDVLLESYLGKRGEPVARDGGYAQRKTKYDLHRRPVEVVLLDATGPVVGADGWAIERSVYDARGLLVRVDHEDVAGRPKLDQLGRASWTKVYDARLNVTEEQNLGEDGKPALARGGWATKRTTFDDRDEVTEETLLGAAGEPVVGLGGWALHKLRRDDFGDVIEESFFDASHQATTLRGATYAAERSRFDDRRRLVEIAYLDARGAPAKGPDGAAFVRYERDPYGRATQTTYLDGAGVPTTSNDGKTRVQTTYDDAGRPVLERFTNATGGALPAADGCAGHRLRYDPQGHETERTCLDGAGDPQLGREGWAIRRTLHDARGNAVDEATYDAQGAPRGDPSGVARTKRTFDARDRLREVTLFGVDGSPAHDARGVHVTVFTYDEDGKQVGESRLDERGRPVAPRR